jgi:hypothetical protein
MERCANRSTARQPSKVGAVCGNAARRVLYGAISNGRPYRDHLTRIAVYFGGNSQKRPECSGRACLHRIANKKVRV